MVIHGKADKLMRPFGGRAIARAIKGARLVLFDGMGHELPRELWDDIVGELKTNFAASRVDLRLTSRFVSHRNGRVACGIECFRACKLSSATSPQSL